MGKLHALDSVQHLNLRLLANMQWLALLANFLTLWEWEGIGAILDDKYLK